VLSTAIACGTANHFYRQAFPSSPSTSSASNSGEDLCSRSAVTAEKTTKNHGFNKPSDLDLSQRFRHRISCFDSKMKAESQRHSPPHRCKRCPAGPPGGSWRLAIQGGVVPVRSFFGQCWQGHVAALVPAHRSPGEAPACDTREPVRGGGGGASFLWRGG
jgi:hypothetical protein